MQPLPSAQLELHLSSTTEEEGSKVYKSKKLEKDSRSTDGEYE
jgi:hypothetical protein